ncbi:hypothetical protein MO293_18440 [Clostridioides difficile]|uniref:hypothetical protein n=1 Tax=Clostridioides difficile TaxID=1496 RepID=UPI001C19340D|nr:hypothetical protein [Clostridioides difficile]HBF3596706.1 hypothetical protein [Clostridioides difficile]HBF3732676.1 hypothetical protein [Clostridioides difficile]HBF9885414.1 hypothetical protein [Clostridioides difficile]HBY2707233.1 hypothetical protein [Clostridioides difficile]
MDFKKLSSEAKLNHILQLQKYGMSRKEIAARVGYTRLDTLDRFMKKKGYLKQDDKYVLIVEDSSHIDVMQVNKIALGGASKAKEDKYTVSVLQSTESQEKLSNILDNHRELIEMLEWFREVKAKYPTVDLLTFTIDYEKSQAIKTTVRVDDDIWKEFSDICKTKYVHMSKVDILSQILKNFIDENK